MSISPIRSIGVGLLLWAILGDFFDVVWLRILIFPFVTLILP